MIKLHEFNTAWWGADVGTVSDAAFFELAPAARLAALERYVWVEFVQPISQLPDRRVLAETGFIHADTQIRFRLDLSRVTIGECSRQLRVERASEVSFSIPAADLRPFQHERFHQIPGITRTKISQRYALWSAKLVGDHPETCLRLLYEDTVQGWFLAQPGKGGLELTLAMLQRDATASGYDLYARALACYAADFRLGFASFSAGNAAVHNIYSAVGARFVEPRDCWLWLNPSGASSSPT